MRAVLSSDFALGQFQNIWNLLLVHGRWSYQRISDLILYFFYKNMIFTIPQFFYAWSSAFSGQTVFDDYFISGYNLFFTALPLIIRGIFDQDINYKFFSLSGNTIYENLEIKKKIPLLYYIGQKNSIFNFKNFILAVFMGIFHSAVIYFYFYHALKFTIMNNQGQISDHWGMTVIAFSSIIFVRKLN